MIGVGQPIPLGQMATPQVLAARLGAAQVHPNTCSLPGLILWWRHKGSVEMGTRKHIALVVFVEEDYFDHGRMSRHARVRLEWIDSRFLRPVTSDYNHLWPQRRDGYR